MNAWLIAATALMVGLLPVPVGLRPPADRSTLSWRCELASTITTLILLLIAQGTHRQPFFDLALVSAVLSFAGGLAFARFLERWV